MIKIENLTKFYGDFKAVDNISFEIDEGEILGFLGPNGAGKTTTLKMLTCFMPPTSGSISFKDLDSKDHSMEIRKMIGYLPENAPIYEYMGVYEYLEYICDLREIHGPRRKARIDKMIEICGLSKMLAKDIGELSKGYRQRVGIAQAMIHEPEILILDEPTVGLDPNQVVEIRNLIKDVGSEKTVILSTHILSEVEAACTRVVIISSGEIVADGTPATLRGQLAGNALIKLVLKGHQLSASESFMQVDGVENAVITSANGSTFVEVTVPSDCDIREGIFRKAVEKDYVILEMNMSSSNLEDVFRKLTVVQSQGGGSI